MADMVTREHEQEKNKQKLKLMMSSNEETKRMDITEIQDVNLLKKMVNTRMNNYLHDIHSIQSKTKYRNAGLKSETPSAADSYEIDLMKRHLDKLEQMNLYKNSSISLQ